ncbi:MAG TPA: 50S ribosomal protein L18 [bacterium]|jgi:large subunit ribosomal protein L18|nr:50S ribosomal protein L18 [bacterium]
MLKRADRNNLRRRRHLRLRRRMAGGPARPRLAVFRSLSHIYAQIVDDARGQTLATASSLDPELRESLTGKRKSEASKIVGALLGRRATAKGIRRVVFDRAGYAYHGRVKALADGAREAGLEF